MIELDGIEYEVKSPEENVDDIVTFVNQYCEDNNIRNSKGEIINIAVSNTNPLYMMTFGLSYLVTVLQKLVYNAGCSLNLAEASDRQLLNIADIAGIKRTAATRTTITGTVYSNIQDIGAVPCVIDKNTLTATVTINNIPVVFRPAFDMTVPVGGSSQIVLIADTYGVYYLSENTIVNFDTNPPGFRKMTTNESVPGQNQESIANLRARIQRRQVQNTMCDRAAEAIQNLEGVSLCSIYFNYNPNQPEEVGARAISVPPRCALLLVQGYNEKIAEVFYHYLLCQTTDHVDPDLGTSIATQYTYTTKAQQQLTVYAIPPAQIPIYIKVYIKNQIDYVQKNNIIDTICSLSASLSIGQEITSAMVLNIVEENYPQLITQGAELSKDDVSYDYIQEPDPDELFIFNIANIQVIGEGEEEE